MLRILLFEMMTAQDGNVRIITIRIIVLSLSLGFRGIIISWKKVHTGQWWNALIHVRGGFIIIIYLIEIYSFVYTNANYHGFYLRLQEERFGPCLIMYLQW